MKKLGVVGNSSHPMLADVLGRLEQVASAAGLQPCYEDTLLSLTKGAPALREQERIDFLLTLGGDGTMLRGARMVAGANVPILGINLGRLGFLTLGGAEELTDALRRMASGDFDSQRRMTLQIDAIGRDGAVRESWIAVNDAVLHKGGFARVVRLRVEVDGEVIATFASDGVVLSTPTGSTAYSLSAGGPIVVPMLESLVLTPISAHSLALRPIVLPPDVQVMVESDEVLEEELLVTVDGQVGTGLVEGEHVIVRRSDAPVIFVRFPGTTFFTRLRRKLGWGGLLQSDNGS